MAGPTTFNAPVHRALGRVNPSGNASSTYPNAAPGMEFLGLGIQDHRLPYNQFNSVASGAKGAGILGWYGSGSVMVADFVPSTLGTALIATLANVASGVAMTLHAGTGITAITSSTLLPGGLISLAGGAGVGNLTSGYAIDGIPDYWRFGSGGSFTTTFYKRSACVGRCVSISGSTSGTGGDFLVSGYDTYGYAMSEKITVAGGANTVNGAKAFKVVTSVVPQFTDAHNYSVGTADIFGLGLYAGVWGSVKVNYNGAWVTASTGFVAGVTTAPATTTTGDVRGTYAVQSASDATKRLVIEVTPSLASIFTNATTGLFGQPQA